MSQPIPTVPWGATKAEGSAEHLYLAQWNQHCQLTDRLFVRLMPIQWVLGLILASYPFPGLGDSTTEQTSLSIWSAVFFGGVLTAMPVALASLISGQPMTRHMLAICQVFFAGLLVQLSGGRLEVQYYLFASLAGLALYRDWRVLCTASIAVCAELFLRGDLPSNSLNSVAAAPLFGQEVEYLVWVCLVNAVLIMACLQSQAAMRRSARFQAELMKFDGRVEQQLISRLEQQDRSEETLKQEVAQLAAEKQRLERLANQLQQQSQEIAEARLAAEQASRSKSEFLANMSHEIRTPITAIMGFADILVDDGDLSKAPDSRIEVIQTIQRNSNNLLCIINDILDLSKIEAGKIDLVRSEIPTASYLEEIISLMKVRAIARKIELSLEYETLVPASLLTDPVRLRQILVNLIGNAIKFTERGGVRLVVRQSATTNGAIEFDVLDTGLGITQEQQQRLFQPFVQADNSTSRSFGGTGLGLTICKRLAGLLGGDVWIVESTPGAGTRFRLSLKMETPPGVAWLEPTSQREPIQIRQALVKKQAPPSNILRSCRVLLVEDGPDNQKLVSFILSRQGANVTIAENGALGLEAAWAAHEQGQPFDVVLMDMQMPVMDGYQATRELRQRGYAGPVIALTAHAMDSDRGVCLQTGCSEFLTKPINRTELVEMVLSFLPGGQRFGTNSPRPGVALQSS